MQISQNTQVLPKDELNTEKTKPSVNKSKDKIKNPVEKTAFKHINDVAVIGVTVASVLQAPENIVFFPKGLHDASNSIKSLPIISKASPVLIKTSKYIEKTRIFNVATALNKYKALNKASFAFGKAVPYLNAVSCGYVVTKSIYTINNEKETTSHKAKAATQIVLNTASAIGAFKSGVGLTVSAVSGIASVGLDLLWK